MLNKDAIMLVIRATEVCLDTLEDYNDIFDVNTTFEEVQKVLKHLKEISDVK